MAKLRIKAEKDLTELERLGWNKNRCAEYAKHTANAYWYIREKDRVVIFSSGMGVWSRTLTELFDLIQADLVEKVEEGE